MQAALGEASRGAWHTSLQRVQTAVRPSRPSSAALSNPLQSCPLRSTKRHHLLCASSAVATGGNRDEDGDDTEASRQQLSRMFDGPSISGQELRELVMEKWGRSYDIRLHKRGRRMYLQIMWKFLEQRSFHLSESEYTQQLDAVAEYLTMWRVAPNVRAGIRSATPRGPGYTGGGGARAVSIALNVDIDGGRSSEWDSF